MTNTERLANYTLCMSLFQLEINVIPKYFKSIACVQCREEYKNFMYQEGTVTFHLFLHLVLEEIILAIAVAKT